MLYSPFNDIFFINVSSKVFEGMALGVETHKKNLIGIAAVILSHKWAEGFTLVNHQNLLLSLTFSIRAWLFRERMLIFKWQQE